MSLGRGKRRRASWLPRRIASTVVSRGAGGVGGESASVSSSLPEASSCAASTTFWVAVIGAAGALTCSSSAAFGASKGALLSASSVVSCVSAVNRWAPSDSGSAASGSAAGEAQLLIAAFSSSSIGPARTVSMASMSARSRLVLSSVSASGGSMFALGSW